MKDKKFKISFFALIIFTVILLVEGFLWYFSSKLSWFCFDTLSFSHWCVDAPVDKKYAIFDKHRHGYNPLIWDEKGLVETLQILFLIISIIYFFQILVFKNKEKYWSIILV